MKTAGKWVGKILAKVIVIVLVIVLLPYAFRLAERAFPELSGRVQVESAALMRTLKASSRLETTTVEEEGVLEANTSVVVLGTVGKTVITYLYKASLGIDLSRVQLKRNGKTITFLIPPLEVLNDSIEAKEVNKNDFFSYAIDKSPETLLAEQQLRCRETFLNEKETDGVTWEHTQKALLDSIGEWLKTYGDSSYTFAFEKLEE